MAKSRLSRELLKKLANEGFFNEVKNVGEVAARLDQKGFSLQGKQISLLSQMLTFLCQDEILERHKSDKGEWLYKKV